MAVRPVPPDCCLTCSSHLFCQYARSAALDDELSLEPPLVLGGVDGVDGGVYDGVLVSPTLLFDGAVLDELCAA